MGKKDSAPTSGPLGSRTERPHSKSGWGSSPRDGGGSSYDPNMKRGGEPGTNDPSWGKK